MLLDFGGNQALVMLIVVQDYLVENEKRKINTVVNSRQVCGCC
jgi:hypothetical protein